MLNYIALYPNKYDAEFNEDFIHGLSDIPIEDYIITAMKEFEAVENVKIEKISIIRDQDEVDINNHMVNINFKKKDLDKIVIPKYKYISQNRYGEIRFTIRISTNLSEKVILKRILLPLSHDGYYLNNNKKIKAIWQLTDASSYSQRGKITLKSRMPIIIYQNRNRVIRDIENNEYTVPSYSYALNSKSKKPGAKLKTKYINPLMIYAAKMGVYQGLEFFGMNKIIEIIGKYDVDDLDLHYIFPLNDIFIRVDKYLFDKYEMVRAVTCLCCNLQSRDFPVSISLLNDKEYWVCRIGYIGSIKNKNIMSFREKGITTIYMIERLLDNTTINNLRLPMIYKRNIYFLLYWLITNFNELKKRNNIDITNKRVRRNEYIVNSSLGKKINENINKLVEKKSKSKMNNMETLLELFNFNSDIVVSGMRNINDLIKSDELSNDMTFLLDLAYSSKGPNSLGEGSSKMISSKYRHLHPSMAGVLCFNTSSNSDAGMSGSFTPFVETFNGYYFTPNVEPCDARYKFDKALVEEESHEIEHNISSFDSYVQTLESDNKFINLLQYEKIEIIEKE